MKIAFEESVKQRLHGPLECPLRAFCTVWVRIVESLDLGVN